MTNMVNITNMEKNDRPFRGLRDIRFVVMLNEQEDKDIQAYRFARQIGSKGEAIRRLIKQGLEVEKMATTGVEIGVLSPVDADNNNHQEMTDAART